MSWMFRGFLNKWPLVLCETQNGNLTRNRKHTGGTSFASPPVLAKPQAGYEMLQFLINATINRDDFHLLVYELDSSERYISWGLSIHVVIKFVPLVQ